MSTLRHVSIGTRQTVGLVTLLYIAGSALSADTPQASGINSRGFLYNGGTITRLGALGGSGSVAGGLDDSSVDSLGPSLVQIRA